MTQTTVNPKTSSLELFSQLLEQLSQGPVVLAIVTATQGQVVSKVGEKLLVWGDAKSAGTLSEYTVKAMVIAQSFEVLKTGIAQRMVIDPGNNMFAVSSDPDTSTSLGQVQVWLTRWQGDDAIATVQTLLESLKVSQSSRFVVPLGAGQYPYIVDTTNTVGKNSPSLRNLQGQDAYIETL